MELGSNSPHIVLPDADMDFVAQSTTMTGYSNAGQVCISTQRLIVQEEPTSLDVRAGPQG